MSKVSTRPRKGATTVAETATAVTVAPSKTDAQRVEDEGSKPANEVSPTLIQLYIRPILGQAFTGDFGRHLDDAGFERHPEEFSAAALLSQDEGKVVATLRPNKHMSFDGWTEATAAIDPQTCALDFDSGRRFMTALRLYAAAHGGAIFDGAGKKLSEDELAAIEQHLESIARDRWHDSHPKKVKQADGSFARMKPLSFTIERYSARGKHLGSNSFDIEEPENEDAAWEKGLEMCREMLQYRKDHRTRHLPVTDIIMSAAAAKNNRKERPNTASAAGAFFYALHDMLGFAARNANIDRYFDGQIERHRSSVAYMAELEAKQRAEFAARMKASKAAKQAQRQGCAA